MTVCDCWMQYLSSCICISSISSENPVIKSAIAKFQRSQVDQAWFPLSCIVQKLQRPRDIAERRWTDSLEWCTHSYATFREYLYVICSRTRRAASSSVHPFRSTCQKALDFPDKKNMMRTAMNWDVIFLHIGWEGPMPGVSSPAGLGWAGEWYDRRLGRNESPSCMRLPSAVQIILDFGGVARLKQSRKRNLEDWIKSPRRDREFEHNFS